MAKDYTSLLGKSAGTSWGEIAGAYLTGGRKKDNRARNVLYLIHISEPTRLRRISYAVFCLKKKNIYIHKKKDR